MGASSRLDDAKSHAKFNVNSIQCQIVESDFFSSRVACRLAWLHQLVAILFNMQSIWSTQWRHIRQGDIHDVGFSIEKENEVETLCNKIRQNASVSVKETSSFFHRLSHPTSVISINHSDHPWRFRFLPKIKLRDLEFGQVTEIIATHGSHGSNFQDPDEMSEVFQIDSPPTTYKYIPIQSFDPSAAICPEFQCQFMASIRPPPLAIEGRPMRSKMISI